MTHRRLNFLILASAVLASPLLGQQLYKHVDETGKVTYTDRPQSGDEETTDIGTPNVATPEASRQIQERMQREKSHDARRLQRQQESNESAARATQAIEDERQRHNEEFPATSVLQWGPDPQPQADDPAPVADDQPSDPPPDSRGRDSDSRSRGEREGHERNERGRDSR